jgi:AraC-like DNA-binding protein
MRKNESIAETAGAPSETPDFISRQVRGSRLFFLNLKPARSRSLAVVCGGFESCATDYCMDRKNFVWLSLEFVFEGRGELVLRGKQFKLHPGMFFVYGPRVHHRILSDSEKPLSKYFVDFTGTEGRRLLKELGLQPGTVRECMTPGRLREDFETLLAMGTRRRDLAPRLCAARLTELLINCSESATEPGSLGSRAYSTYERCRGMIEQDFARLRSLSDIAKTCHADAAYLCRLFSRFGKESPHQFLLRMKIGKASELLLQSKAPVKQVAEAVGFLDPFHFSKVFRRFQGVPPARFALSRRQA